MTPYVFILLDLVVALSLTEIARLKNKQQMLEIWPEVLILSEEESNQPDDKRKIAVISHEDEELLRTTLNEIDTNGKMDLIWNDVSKPMDSMIEPINIGSLYLLNPYSVFICLAESTQLFNTLFVILAISYAMKGKLIPTFIFLALATYLSLYPIVLMAPCILFLSRKRKSSVTDNLLFRFHL
jgi:hypothetical protein